MAYTVVSQSSDSWIKMKCYGLQALASYKNKSKMGTFPPFVIISKWLFP